MEDENDNNGLSTAKHNECQRQARVCQDEVEQRAHEETEHHQVEEQQRVQTERYRAEEQVKKCISLL